MTTNFITPPDFVDNENDNVLIVDASVTDIESVAILLSTHPRSFNIYLFRADMDARSWLDKAVDIADTIIVNTDPTDLSLFKSRLLSLPNTQYYDSNTGYNLTIFDHDTND